MLENKRAQYVYEHKIKARKIGIQENSWQDQLGNWRSSVDYEIYGIDFSKGLPEEIENIPFDYIISTYAMHYLEDKDKNKFINKLENHLNKDGKIIIGDIAFKTRELLEQCKAKYDNYWDDEQIHFVYDELKECLFDKHISFTAISHCSGVIQILRS